jgi:hypothetical protein
MKISKYTFWSIFFISVPVILFSCNTNSFNCNCSTAGKSGQSYNLGNISLSDATGKCSSLKTQYGWDSCPAIDEK